MTFLGLLLVMSMGLFWGHAVSDFKIVLKKEYIGQNAVLPNVKTKTNRGTQVSRFGKMGRK